jgi:hypothetical protein
MTEREMEDLLWEYPDKFIDEKLEKFRRQPSSNVGRADLVFKDRLGRLLVVELKRDTLERGAITQLVDYYGMMKAQYPDTPVELMVIANRIPAERRLACERQDITAIEIPHKKFRDVAAHVGYVCRSERDEPDLQIQNRPAAPLKHFENGLPGPLPLRVRNSTQKAWFFLKHKSGPFFLAFVNAKGSCSMRTFAADDGRAMGKDYGTGDYQEDFREFVQGANELYVRQQPNLERACKDRLPSDVLAELRAQMPAPDL